MVAGDALRAGAVVDKDHLLIALAIGAAANLILGIGLLIPALSKRAGGTLNVALDALLIPLFIWALDGAAVPVLAFGAAAVLGAALHWGWSGLGTTLLVLVGGVALAGWGLVSLDDAGQMALLLSLALLPAFGALGITLRGTARRSGPIGSDTVEKEARRLRATRERARAIFEVAKSLSSTLNHRRVLEAAQAIGELALREDLGPDVRLISAVLLFQGEDNQLRVITSRGLTRADESVAVPGRRGVLGLALQQAEPVFAGDPDRDPELRYFVAFQESRSILAIPLRAGFDVYGVMVFAADRPNAYTDEHVELMTAIGTQSTIALQNAVLYQNLATEKERIVGVEEDARKKLARDLHDGPTQSVAAIAMRVNYIRRLLERQPQQAVEELWKVEDLARRTTKEIRHMLFTLRPLVLETQGLAAALRQLAEKMRDTHDTVVIVECQSEVEMYLDTNAQGVLFYIIEEAVNNARKHAQSEQIWVRLYRREGFIIVEIEDNGVGFDVEAVDANYDQRGSLGMINMRERAELVEGTLRIQSARGQGTKISVLVPSQAAGGTGALGAGEEPLAPLRLQSQRAAIQKSTEPPPEPPASASRPKPLIRLQPENPGTGPLGASRSPSDTSPKPGTGPLRPLPSQTKPRPPRPTPPPRSAKPPKA